MAGGLAVMLLTVVVMLARGERAPEQSDQDLPRVTVDLEDDEDQGAPATQEEPEVAEAEVAEVELADPGPAQAATTLQGALPPAKTNGGDDLFALGRKAGARLDPDGLEDILYHVEASGLGEVEVLRETTTFTHLRLSSCSGCQQRPEDAKGAGCPFETGYLEGALTQLKGEDVVVQETACGRNGGSTCEFGIWH